MQKAELVIGLAFAVEGPASSYVNQGEMKRAAQFFAWVNAMRGKMGDSRPPVEQASIERDLDFVHSRLSDSDFAMLATQGERRIVDEAVALALEE